MISSFAGREVRRIRAEALPKLRGGLRALYRTLEFPGANPLKTARPPHDFPRRYFWRRNLCSRPNALHSVTIRFPSLSMAAPCGEFVMPSFHWSCASP